MTPIITPANNKPRQAQLKEQTRKASTKLFQETGRLYPGMGIQLPWKYGIVKLRIQTANRRGTKGKLVIDEVIEYEVKADKASQLDK